MVILSTKNKLQTRWKSLYVGSVPVQMTTAHFIVMSGSTLLIHFHSSSSIFVPQGCIDTGILAVCIMWIDCMHIEHNGGPVATAKHTVSFAPKFVNFSSIFRVSKTSPILHLKWRRDITTSLFPMVMRHAQ